MSKYGPKFEMELVGHDGNAFAIMGRFSRLAKRAGWTQEQIKSLLDEAKSGNYDHLLGTIMSVIDEPDCDDDWGDDDG